MLSLVNTFVGMAIDPENGIVAMSDENLSQMVDLARKAGDDAVSPQPLLVPVGQGRLLGEGAGVDQALDPLAHRQLALLGGLIVVALRAAGEGGLQRVPGERGALDAHGVVAHAREDLQLFQVRASGLRPRGRRDQVVELLEERLGLRLRHPLDALRHHRGGRGRDRAALALEGDLGDAALLVESDRHMLLVAAERVGVLELEIGLLQAAEVMRPLVVLEDLVSVELVHHSRG